LINSILTVGILEFYGVEAKFKALIDSYLTGRYQRVALDNITSEWEKIKCGVPQGSILGPMFFLIYINDLPTLINKDNNTVLFADDTSIVITDSNTRDFNIIANQIAHDINTWFNIILLTLNLNKTQYIEFRTKNYYNVNTLIKYDQRAITNATDIKFLGLIIDDTLSWKQHIEHLVNKMCTACYALRNIKHVAAVHTLRVIYFTHTHSIMSYGIIFWGSSSYANKAFILQKKIIGIITNTEPRDSRREVFKNMEIMMLYS
jgi:hypothetical protein